MDRFKDIEKKIIEAYKNNKKDVWQLNYHFETLFGLINDPNGLSYFSDEYYIFYQWNPLGLVHKNKCWGLVKTKDFINYTIPRLVLKPENYYDKDGVYSGSAIPYKDKLNMLYTGNVKDKSNNRSSYQCLVSCDKDDNIINHGPVLSDIPEGYTAHFRDPKVFIRNNDLYFVIGAQNNDLKGRALIYKSADFKDWKFCGEISTKYKDFGFMWECPNLLNMEGKDVLIFSPQGLPKQEYKYQNIYQSGYIVGDLNYNTLNFEHGEFKELDFGTDFYAPQVFEDNKGRNIMIAWMGLPEEEESHPTMQYNRVHCLTMPRELFLKDGHIYQKPIEEMTDLRTHVIDSVENLKTTKWQKDNIKENSYEVELKINKLHSDKVIIKSASSEDEAVNLIIDFDKKEIIYQNNLVQGNKQVRKIKCDDIETSINLRIFMDKSALEIYINEGKYTFSNRIYPKAASTGFEVYSDKDTFEIIDMKMWSLGGFRYDK